jgi:flagellar hook-associated protein 3 FlgL
MASQLGVNAILDQQSKLLKTQLELSTGKKILTPSDDPAGQVRLQDINESINTNNQYQDNIDTVRSRLELEESVMGGVTEILQRANELAVQGVNATQTAETRKGMAIEVRQLIDQMMGLANKQNANGEYIFAGNKVGTKPYSVAATVPPALPANIYTYDGDGERRSLQISDNRRLTDGDPGIYVFGDTTTVPSSSAFDALEKFATDMEANAPDSAVLTDIQDAMGTVLEARSSAGARLNTLDLQENINADFILDLETAKSVVEDLDYTEAISRFNLETVGLQAAQQAYAKVQGLSLFNYL